MTAALSFQLLGELQVMRGAQPVPLRTGKLRVVLATLLLRANHMVSADELIDRLWGDDPPAKAWTTAQAYVMRLRQVLGDDTKRPELILTRPGGYLITIASERLDIGRFRTLVAQAVGLDAASSAAKLHEALSLWRGAALAGVASESLRRDELPQLAEERLLVLERRIELDLDLERHGELVGELSTLTTHHPYRERFRSQLMLALFRSGRQADALDSYREIRDLLDAELGVEPGPALRRLHEAILRSDPQLHLAIPLHDTEPTTLPARLASPSRPPPRPAQLPADIVTFTGRTAELNHLMASWPTGAANPAPSTVVISAIDGMAGIGKTALAVHAAHQIQDRFPDGQLFVDLHGFAQGIDPAEPADALDRLLRALGTPGEQIPHTLEERAALLRTTLAGRRVLLVLDNAATETQVRPLLPGTPGCLVLITSRRRLAGLDDAHLMSVDVLPLPDAVRLFAAVAGLDRLTGPLTGLAEQVVELCGRLPLAIRLVAARLRARPAWNLTHLLGLLRDHQHRLAELQAGQRSVVASFDLSYQQLTGDQRRLLRLLSLHPGPDLDTHAAAALANTTVEQTRRMLEDLLDCHLLEQRAPGRYRFHDLLRAYAARLAAEEEPEVNRGDAVTRLFDYNLYAASVAMDLVYPYEAGSRPPVRRPSTPTPSLTTQEQGAAWLDTEHANLLAIAAHAAEHWAARCIALSATLHRHLCIRAHYTDAHALHTHALRLAQAIGDRTGELTGLAALGHIHYLLDQHGKAADCFEGALAIAQEVGDRDGEQAALRGLGDNHRVQGRHDRAIDCYQRSLAIARDLGNRIGEFYALWGLGDVHQWHDRYDLASDCQQQALATARDLGNRTGEFWALQALGNIHLEQGAHQEATDCYQQALATARDLGDQLGELYALWGFGQVHRAQGQYDLAADCYQQCLAIARDLGDRNGQFEALWGLGHTHHATGDSHLALTHHQHALLLARELDQPHDQARAHDGLARAHQALDHPDQARTHWQHALAIYTELGIPEADDVRAHLTELDRAVEVSGTPSG